MNKKKVYILEDRGILFVQGKDAKGFLQNLITNDIDKVNETNSCFASLLTPQGKYLFDFLIVKHKNGYFLDCEKIQIENLYNQLDLYKLRSKVEILNLSNEFVVATLSNERFLEFEGAKNLPGFTIKYREDPIFLEPRKKELGGRIVVNLEKPFIGFCLGCQLLGEVLGGKVIKSNPIEIGMLDIHLNNSKSDDKILVIYKNGTYEISSIDLSKRFNFSNIDILSKFNAKDIISCVHYIGSKKSYYIKRFKIETNQTDKTFS